MSPDTHTCTCMYVYVVLYIHVHVCVLYIHNYVDREQCGVLRLVKASYHYQSLQRLKDSICVLRECVYYCMSMYGKQLKIKQ